MNLAEARKVWRTDLWKVYRQQLPYTVVVGGVIIAASAAWLAEKSAELAVISTILQVVSLPFLALAPASAFVGPYPTAGELEHESKVSTGAPEATTSAT